MNEKNESKKTDSNGSKKTESKTESKPIIIGTTELSEILSEKLNRKIETKYIRNIFRNDLILNNFDDSEYTKYKFLLPSKLLNDIIERFIQIENERIERKKRTIQRKTEKRIIENSVYDYDDTGKLIKKTVK